MLQKLSKILLLSLSASLLVGCPGQGPKIDVCISMPEKGGFVCVDKDQNPYFKDFATTDKYVAFSPADAKALLSFCGISGKEKKMAVEYYNRAVKLGRE